MITGRIKVRPNYPTLVVPVWRDSLHRLRHAFSFEGDIFEQVLYRGLSVDFHSVYNTFSALNAVSVALNAVSVALLSSLNSATIFARNCGQKL